jgi:hypothetical protein
MGLAVVLGFVLLYGLLHGWGANPEPTASDPTTGSSASPRPHDAAIMDKADAKEIEDGLVSNYRPTLNDVLADGYKPPLSESGTVVKIDRDSLRRYKSAGQVRATVTEPGKEPVSAILYLQRDGSDWRVCAVDGVR